MHGAGRRGRGWPARLACWRGNGGIRAQAIAHAAGRCGLHNHLRVIVLVALGRIHQFKFKTAQQQGKNGFDLEDSKAIARAFVLAAPKGLVGHQIAVFFAPHRVAFYIKHQRVFKQAAHALRHGGRCPNHIARFEYMLLKRHIHQHLAHQQNQRWVQAQHFFEYGFERGQLAQAVECHLAILAQHRIDFFFGLRQQMRVPQQLDQHPGCCARAGVVPRKNRGNQQAGDFIGVERAAVGIGGVDQALQHVMRFVRLLLAFGNDAAH